MRIEDMFTDTTDDDKEIAEGRLLHLWPDTRPWVLISPRIAGQFEDKSDTFLLVNQAIDETLRQLELNPRTDLVILDHKTIGPVWVRPNSHGGMTITLPKETN